MLKVYDNNDWQISLRKALAKEKYFLNRICLFYVPLNITITGERLQVLTYARYLAIEQWGFYCVPHPPWHGSSVYNGHLRGPVTLAPVVERLTVTTEPPGWFWGREIRIYTQGSKVFLQSLISLYFHYNFHYVQTSQNLMLNVIIMNFSE